MIKTSAKPKKSIILIKKANELIESRYKFDIWETRLFLCVLAQIKRNDTDFKEAYRIYYKDVKKIFNLKSGDSYKYLRNAAETIGDIKFKVGYENDGVRRRKEYRIIKSTDVVEEGYEEKAKATNQDYLEITIDTDMKDLLLQLANNFTTYDLRNVTDLGVYPIRIYELLKQYEKIGWRQLEVDHMKEMFEVTEQYKRFSDFYRFIVKPAVKEINQSSDLIVETDSKGNVEKIKKGRQVIALRFNFRKKTAAEMQPLPELITPPKAKVKSSRTKKRKTSPAPIEQAESQSADLFSTFQETVVQKFGVTPSVFLKMLESHTAAEVEQAISVTHRAKFQQRIKTNIAGYFIKALRDGYTDPAEEAKKKKGQTRKTSPATSPPPTVAEVRAAAINTKIWELVNANPQLTTQAIEQLSTVGTATAQLIATKTVTIGRALTIQDYRDDEELRQLVKAQIMVMHKEAFVGIV